MIAKNSEDNPMPDSNPPPTPRWPERNGGAAPPTDPIDEGGLRAPPGLTGWRKAWWWFDFIILVKLARLRFIAVLVVIGAVITQWDLLAAHYEKWTRPKGEAHAGSSEFEWFCPMHPTVVRDNPKEKCPICFMPLSKRKKGDVHEEALPAGVVNRVQLSPYRVVLAGTQTWKVDYVPLSKEINAVGYVEFNEEGFRNVSARVKGRIDTLFVNQTGQIVEAGEVLASLYSPELLVSVDNLLTAKRSNNTGLLNSARTRLQLLGIDKEQIDEIVRTGQANTHLKIRTPITGHVIKKYVLEGQYVDEGTPLYDIADLSTVWIEAQVYEDDLAFLPMEQVHQRSGLTDALPVTATTRAFPNQPFEGQLTFIYPHIDQQTRTVTVRSVLKNPDHKLRPGTTATVRIHVAPKDIPLLQRAAQTNPSRMPADMLEQGQILAVPERAVIDTGRQTIVYRQSLPGTFEGVQVELGPKMSGPDGVVYYPLLSGLEPGDLIVTSGSFLIDAETRLNPAAGSIYFGGSSGSKGGQSSVTTVRPSTPEDGDAKINAALAKLSPADRALAEAQKTCPILGGPLGGMGVPVKLTLDGQPVFVCCEGCKPGALESPQETLAKVAALKSGKPAGSTAPTAGSAATGSPTSDAKEAKIQGNLAKLSDADRALAEAQRFCAILPTSRLGSMGKPIKLTIDGRPAFLCCEGCREEALSNPKETLDKVARLKARHGAKSGK